MRYVLSAIVVLVMFAPPPEAAGQEVHQELQETVEAEVLAIVDERERDIVGTDATALVQTVKARVESGEKAGDVVTLEQDLVTLAQGDDVFLNRLISINGVEYYEFKDFDRRGMLITLAALFVGLLLLFAGRQGARALVSLLLSIGAILFVLVPALLAGYPPVPVSVGVAGIVLALVLFITHKVNARSVIAFFGTFSAVVATGGIATFWVEGSRLTGFGSDASVYLNFSTQGSLDFAGLLLGSIIIGILGVLDDVSITQASVVQELRAANDRLNAYELYHRAIRVGRDHVGSLVNTLAFAYIGVSLPLVLLLARTDSSFGAMVNQEIVAAELVRIIVGSIGLVLAVPLTTAIAAWWFGTRGVDPRDVEEHGHHHH